MENVTTQGKEYLDYISNLRNAGQYEQAIFECDKAIEKNKKNHLLYKIKGDILFSISRYKEALDSYLVYLKFIKLEPIYFTNFSRFFAQINQYISIDEDVFKRMYRVCKDNNISDVVRKGIIIIICDYWPASQETNKLIDEANSSYSDNSMKPILKWLATKDDCEKIYFLSKLKPENCKKINSSTDKKILSLMEELFMYDAASMWVQKMLTYMYDGVLVRTFFRLCRLRNDYSEAIAYMNKNDLSSRADFNSRYELVLFYNFQGDEENRNKTLKAIETNYQKSIPIAQTLLNFYLKFDMIENARAIEKRINDLKEQKQLTGKEKKRIEKAAQESQNLLWDKINGLLEEQAHNRQLLAITDLIKGFSHELGQPITNIRYAIQLYNLKNEKLDIKIDERLQLLLDGILSQTERVGKLLGRFAPIVSSRNVKEYFYIYDEIEAVFEEMNVRLNMEGILYKINGSNKIQLFGETIQFSQIFYNLIINSIHAIKKRRQEGLIVVDIKEDESNIIVIFSDNGIGIPKELQRKIFEPFFSTKKKEVEEGGEGLGLYIVWNILKMFDGKIYVDSEYLEGARFVMEIKKEKEK